MEVVGLAARLQNLTAEHHVERLSAALDSLVGLEPLPDPLALPLWRRAVVTWAMLYVSSLLLYFVVAGLDYLVVFRLIGSRTLPPDYLKTTNVRREITMSVRSLSIMTALSVPSELLVQLGYSKIYHNVDEYGWAYLAVSPLLFLAFSDCIIYFVHRGLHHRLLYKSLHKPHHSFIHTTPFAAFAFHPVDGYLQGFAYHLFAFLAPMHGVVHLASLAVVSMWTINIHDRVSLGIPGVNGAMHHTVHHTTFKSNYGQYTTLWDRLFGTYKDPWEDPPRELSEKEVYGKYA